MKYYNIIKAARLLARLKNIIKNLEQLQSKNNTYENGNRKNKNLIKD